MAKTKDDGYLSASYILDNKKETLSISPGLDLITNGGIPQGTLVILESPPKVGKTTLALKIATKAQQQWGAIVVYISVEHRLSIKNLKGIPGLDLSTEKFKLVSSTPDNILSTEQILERGEKALIDFPNCLAIVDSFSSLSSAKEKTGGYGTGYGGLDSRKLEGEFCRRISPILLTNDNIVVGIAHVTPNISSVGSSVKISRAMLYQLDVRLSLKKAYPGGDWMSGDKLIGQKVAIECLTSALGGPGLSYNAWLKYGEGFLDEAEIAEMASDLEIINKKGAGWYEVGEEKVQGFINLCELLKNNKALYKDIFQKVKGSLE